jgi:hypothetical protein
MPKLHYPKTIIIKIAAIVGILVISLSAYFLINKNQAKSSTQNSSTNSQNDVSIQPAKLEPLHLDDLKDLAQCQSYNIKKGNVVSCTLQFDRDVISSDFNSVRFQLVSPTASQANSIKPVDFTCVGTDVLYVVNCNLDTSDIKVGTYATYITVNGESKFGVSENIKIN